MKNRVVSLFLVISFSIGIAGCGDGNASSVTSPSESSITVYNFDYSDATVLSDEEYESIRTYLIDCLDEKGDCWGYSQLDYFRMTEETDNMMKVGLRGVPPMADLIVQIGQNIDYIRENHSDTMVGWSPELVRDYYWIPLYGILRLSTLRPYIYLADPKCACGDGTHTDLSTMSCFLSLVEKDCPAIIASNKTLDEKLAELAKYGILAIPYVLVEIENGNTEYDRFFTVIGLHITDQEFQLSLFYLNDIIEERMPEFEADPRAESFDYKVWLEENREDLDAMYKYFQEFKKF